MSKRDYMHIPGLVLGGLLMFCVLFSGPARAVAAETVVNTCVHCHAGLPNSSFPGVKSHSWSGSVHQKHGVTCDKCHGGNPAAEAQKEAHAGVLGSSDRQSSVYYKNIPATCGQCHGAEFYKFSQSLHYKMLQSTGRGPECVTCHGSMVTSILSPDNLVTVCERCHNDRMGIRPYIPQKARAVLLLLRVSQSLVEAAEKLHPPVPGSEEAAQMRAARSFLHSAKLGWHKFDLDAITNDLQKMYNSLKMCRKTDNGTMEKR